MPAAAMSWIAPAALGAVGLLGQQDAQRRANNAQKKAGNAQDQALALQNALSEIQLPAYQELASLARNFDPVKEARGTVDNASKIFQSNVGRAINNSMGANATLGNSTEGRIRDAEALAGPNEAFKSFLADALGNGTQKRAAMYQAVLNQPVGQLANGYFQAANQIQSGIQQPNWGGVTGLLSQAINQYLQRPAGSPTQNGRGGGWSSDY